MKTMKITSFIGKGGVGKSTLAVLLSLYFKSKSTTICIGLDQQHNHRDIIQSNGYDIEFVAITNKISQMIEDIIANSFIKGFREYGELVMPSFVSIVELAELVNQVDAKYDNLVIDMPPNTQGLLLLNMPPVLNNMAFKGLTLKNRINRMVKGKDIMLDNIDYINEISEKLKDYINVSDFFVVGIATELGLLECQRAVTKLQQMKYSIPAVIVNMVEPIPEDDCGLCHDRYQFAKVKLAEYNKYFEKMNIPVIQIPFSFDMDVIHTHLINELHQIQFLD